MGATCGEPRSWQPSVSQVESRTARNFPSMRFISTKLVAEIEGWLDDPFGGVDTILVNAPPGYGKSTLLAQWAASTRFPVLWYHLDASDSDPATLIYGLIHVLRTYAPRRPWATRNLLQHAQGGALTTSELRRAAEVFSKDIGAHIAKPLVLVLTGVDHLEPQGEARALLEHLLARPRDQLQLILEYRDLEALKFSTPLVQGRIRSIGLDALQCTREELAELLAARGLPHDAAYLDDLQSLCDGWVAGVTLATGLSLPEVRAARTTDEFNHKAVFDYATREVLRDFPDTLRDFAVSASVLDDMTAPLCHNLLGIDDAREQLVALTRATGMVSRFGGRPDESVFRFQPLLREVLRQRLSETRGADGVAGLRVRAAWLLEQVGDEHSDEQAAHLYALAGAANELIALIERKRPLLLRSGRGATLTRWIDLLGPEQRREHPDLVVLQAELHRGAGRTPQAEAALEQACARLVDIGEENSATMARALLVRADLRYIRGRYADARSDCDRAIALLPADADDLQVRAHFLLVACVNMLEGPDRAEAFLSGIEARCRVLGDHSALARLFYVRAMLRHAGGAYLDAEKSLTAAIYFAGEAGDKVRLAVSRLYRGTIRQHLGQAAEAREDLHAALALSDEIGHRQVQAYVYIALADLDVLSGHAAAALEQVAEAKALGGELGDQHLHALIAVTSSRIWALTNDADLAVSVLQSTLDDLESTPEAQDWAMLQTALGFALYTAGQLDEAIWVLDRVIPAARERRVLADCAQAYLILAAVRLAQDAPQGAVEVLSTAFDLAEQIDGTAVSLLDARHLPALWPLLAAMTHPIANKLLAAVTPVTVEVAASSEAVETDPAPIRIQLLGECNVYIGEQPVKHWQRTLAKDLLLYLLSSERPVRRSEIHEALWPKKSEKAADDEFRKVRFALKEVLGRQCLVENNGYWSLDIACWVDVREFQRLTNDGTAHAKRGDDEKAIRALREALSLWHGAYLDDQWSDWAVARREIVQLRYTKALDLLAALLIEKRCYDEVEELSLRLLAESELNEIAHRRLMICYAERGNFTRAHEQWLRCRTVLRRQLRIEPSAETFALREIIRARATQKSAELARSRA